jgi:hypothetical protein
LKKNDKIKVSNNKSTRKRRYSIGAYGNFEMDKIENFEIKTLQKQLTQQKNYPTDKKY